MKRKRERLGEPRRYTFKLYPNACQTGELSRQVRMMAELWNALLERNETLYRHTRGQKGVVHREGKSLMTYYDMTADITQLRQSLPEWSALSALSAYRVANALAEAYQAFFRRIKEFSNPQTYERRAAEFRQRKGRNPTRFELAGYPKFRSLKLAEWLPHRFASGCKLTPHGDERERRNGRKSHDKWRLILKGIQGQIKARGEFPRQPLDWSDADLRYYDGHWWLSVGIETAPERQNGVADLTVRFGLIDAFCDVEGSNIALPDLTPLQMLASRIDTLKSERDLRWPFKPGQRPCRASREMSRRVQGLSADLTRARREWLHEWTTQIVAHAASLTIVAPKVREMTQAGQGNEKEWGAAVGVRAMLNRHVLAQAPAAAVQMLKYKAAEAKIPCTVIDDAKPQVAVGRDLSLTVKAGRKARRVSKESAI